METINHFESRFSGIGRLYGRSTLSSLLNAHVAVIGIGGVGSWTAEALVRSGVGKITLVDLDDICISNTNRQLHTLHNNIGQQKVNAMAERMKLINPDCQVSIINDFFMQSNAEDILSQGFDYVVDAIDSLRSKVTLIAMCKHLHIPMVTVGGAGGRRNPAMIQHGDLNESYNDPLLRKVRRQLRIDHQFPEKGDFGIASVFSPERPYMAMENGDVCLVPKKKKLSLNLNCNSGFGTASFVTGTFGFTAAAVAVAHLTDKEI